MAELPPSLGLSQQRRELPAENSPVTLALLSTKNGTILMLAISWELLPRHFLPVGWGFFLETDLFDDLQFTTGTTIYIFLQIGLIQPLKQDVKQMPNTL